MAQVLAFEDWPLADRTMWAHLTEAGDVFDDQGALSHLRPSSLHTRVTHYGRWLRWLQLHEPEALHEPPETRANPERIRHWLEDLDHTRPMSRLAFVDSVLRVLSAAAPHQDWTMLKRVRAHLRRAAGTGDPARKHGRILTSGLLFEAGLREALATAASATTELGAMKARRNGTMIAFLALIPMRRRALAGLVLGQSLLRDGDQFHVALPPCLTKTGQPWEARVPTPVVPLVTSYLDEVRPWLLSRGGEDHGVIWVGDDGRPFDPNYLGLKIRAITHRLTGVPVPPHFFRHAAATTLVRDAPESARLVRGLLGHSDVRTAERHYIHAQAIEAGRSYADVLGRIRKGR